jgi:hypothetical protein
MIEWKEGAVCYANGDQWFASEIASYTKIFNHEDFQLNEIRIGDYIEREELDHTGMRNSVIDVFKAFGLMAIVSTKGLEAISSPDEISSEPKRKLTYNQMMAIGKLKRMMSEKSAPKSAPKTTAEVSADIKKVTANKYEREIQDRQGNNATVDVYDVLKAFEVTCPATQHAVKKLLCSGIRGHKDLSTDLIEAKESIVRAIELNGL